MSMKVFPIGLVDSTTESIGILDSIEYAFFEPNSKVTGADTYLVDELQMQDHTIATNKRGEPVRNFSYEYENIFDREYKEIEHFMSYVGEALTSCYAIDLSMGEPIATVSSPYELTISLARKYSTVEHIKSNYAFVWNGSDFMIGAVTDTDSTSITLSHSYGLTTITNGKIYPMYEVYIVSGAIQNFKPVVFYESDTADSGWVWSGSVAFKTKYTV